MPGHGSSCPGIIGEGSQGHSQAQRRQHSARRPPGRGARCLPRPTGPHSQPPGAAEWTGLWGRPPGRRPHCCPLPSLCAIVGPALLPAALSRRQCQPLEQEPGRVAASQASGAQCRVGLGPVQWSEHRLQRPGARQSWFRSQSCPTCSRNHNAAACVYSSTKGQTALQRHLPLGWQGSRELEGWHTASTQEAVTISRPYLRSKHPPAARGWRARLWDLWESLVATGRG